MKAYAVIAALLLPSPVLAQAYQCSIPPAVAPVGKVKPDGPQRRMAITGYTLAASWSPDYCKMSGDTRSMQCSGQHGRFGFVLHGIWPEGANGTPPQWCDTSQVPTPQALRPNLCMTPSASLLAREWAKHGSCMAKTPTQYFNVAQILWGSIRWPDADRISRMKGLTAGDLRRAFVLMNPSWRSEHIGLNISNTGWLREVQLCYSQRFMPTACSKRHLGPADGTPIKIWRGL